MSNFDTYDSTDVEANKIMAALAYLLFFLPLIVCPGSRFGKFHANQGLTLFIVSAVGSAVIRFIPLLGRFISPLYSLAILILAIVGAVNALNGRAEPLPVIGTYTLLH